MTDGILIHALDSNDIPLQEVTVHLLESDAQGGVLSAHALGKTDGSGLLTVDPLTAEQGSIVATKQGYTPAEFAFSGSAPTAVFLYLRAGTCVTGEVIHQEDGTPASHAQILAWPTDLLLAPVQLGINALRGDPRCHTTVADERGIFRLDSLPPDTAMTLVAGAMGCAMAAPMRLDHVSCQEPVTLPVFPLYGVELRLIRADTGLPPFDERILPLPRHPFDSSEAQGTYLPAPNFAAELAGLDLQPTLNSALTRRFLFVGDSNTPSLGPVRYMEKWPGFAEASSAIAIPRVGRKLAVEEIGLTPEAVGFGSLGVAILSPVLQSLGASADSAFLRGAMARIKLLRDDGAFLEYRLGSALGDAFLITEVPYGTYRARLVSALPGFSYPPPFAPDEYVTVSSDPTEWIVDLSDAGAIVLEFCDPHDQAYAGPVTMQVFDGTLETGGPTPSCALFLHGPRVVLPVPKPGTYSVQAVSPPMSRHRMGLPSAVVRPGGIARVLIMLDV